MLAILAQADQTLFLPKQASTVAPSHDALYHFVLWMSVFFTALIAGLLVYFVIKYRRKSHYEVPDGPTHSTAIELGWTLPPLILVMVIFTWGFRGFLEMSQAPNGAYQVQVNATKWSWAFTYANGMQDSELHVPVDTPISVVLTSGDVIHSMYVPAFRIKKDAVPGRYNKTWFQATELGEYDLFCAEYCGQQHSTMLSKVVVHTKEGFLAHLQELEKIIMTMPPVELGKRTWKVKGCNACHSVEGIDGTGPKWNDVFGSERKFTDGSSIVADENYIRESILNPAAHVVQGFDNVMPTFQGQIRDQEITGVIEYLKSISKNYDGMVLEAPPAPEGAPEGAADSTDAAEPE